MSMFSSEIKEKLQKSAIIAVLVVDNASDGVPLAKTLLDGGIDMMELTLRTQAAIAALKEIKSKVPEMTAGIGTILRPEQVVEAKESGAVFGVAREQGQRDRRYRRRLRIPALDGLRGGAGNPDSAISGYPAISMRAKGPRRQDHHEQKTSQEPLTAVQGQGGLGCDSRREDLGRISQAA